MLKEQLKQDLKDSMKSGDTLKRDVLRSVLNNISLKEKDTQKEFDESGVLDVVASEAKKRRLIQKKFIAIAIPYWQLFLG